MVERGDASKGKKFGKDGTRKITVKDGTIVD